MCFIQGMSEVSEKDLTGSEMRRASVESTSPVLLARRQDLPGKSGAEGFKKSNT